MVRKSTKDIAKDCGDGGRNVYFVFLVFFFSFPLFDSGRRHVTFVPIHASADKGVGDPEKRPRRKSGSHAELWAPPPSPSLSLSPFPPVQSFFYSENFLS